MGDVIHLVLTDFWSFVAAVILIGAVGDAVANIVAAWRKDHG